MTLTVRAPAKVNLALQVGQRRPDGYHDLTTVFMAVDLFDHVSLDDRSDGRIAVDIGGEGAALVPQNGTDLAGRAAALLKARCGRPDLGARLVVDKAIPVAAGLAGGSADAAATLRGCNALWGLGLADAELAALAAELGADVPFSLLGGVALGTERGDRLAVLPCLGSYHWVFALAEAGLRTPAVFAEYDRLGLAPAAQPLTSLVAALADDDQAAVGAALANDLQPAALSLRPELAETLATGAARDGVLGAVLAGSGPTCAFLCASAGAADEVAASLPSLPQVASTRVARGPAPGATA